MIATRLASMAGTVPYYRRTSMPSVTCGKGPCPMRRRIRGKRNQVCCQGCPKAPCVAGCPRWDSPGCEHRQEG